MNSLTPARGIYSIPALPAPDFNRLAEGQQLPFRWQAEPGKPIDPAQISFTDPAQRDHYIYDGRFTTNFERAYRHLAELKRQSAVKASYAERRPIVYTADLSALPPAEKQMVRHLLTVADMIETLFLRQTGAHQNLAAIEARRDSDPDSYNLFRRNHGPWAEAPKSVTDPFANAHPAYPEQVYGVYPPDIGGDPEAIAKLPDEMKGHFTVVTRTPEGALKAIPYHDYFRDDMHAIANELEAGARAIAGVPDEKALHDYLNTAAIAFRTGDWDSADVKWSAMNSGNSKYALRVAPDETYWEPGNTKAGFQFWFARIDAEAAKIDPDMGNYKDEIEQSMASLSRHYKAREIKFQMPDFIDMARVSGDQAHAYGAVLGEKLPNFNDKITPRMVVMTNYYTDADSRAEYAQRAQLLLNDAMQPWVSSEKSVSLRNTKYHEMTHSFGPEQVAIVKNPDGTDKLDADGKPIKVEDALGGRNASVFEELKAQTGALFLTGWWLGKGKLSPDEAKEIYTDAVLWCFRHISEGMVDKKDGKPKAYSQLAGVQLRAFMDAGAMRWENGKFTLDYAKFHDAAKNLLGKIFDIYTLGDRPAVEFMLNDVTSGPGFDVIHARDIAERMAPYPKPSFELRVSL